MDGAVLTQIVLFYVALIISLTFHEASHALFALLGGDRTAYAGGQVTLNPVPHIRREPFGMVILPVLMLIMTGGTMCLGYAHIPVDPSWAERHPRRAALMSAAGPMANFALAAIAFLGLKLMVGFGAADASATTRFMSENMSFITPVDPNSGTALAGAKMLTVFLILNVVLGIFNLFPWPPLDGSGVVQGLFPRQTRKFYDSIRTSPFLPIIGIVVIWQLLGGIAWPTLALIRSWI